jgi:hypothetical protein
MLTTEILEKIKANPDKADEILNEAGLKIEEQKPDPDAGAGDDLSKVPDSVKRLISELRDENAKHRKQKQDAKAAQEVAERKALEEQSKYKELYERTNSELETLKQSAQEAITRAQSLEEMTRKELLEKLPANTRANYKTMPVDTLKLIVTDFVGANPHSPGGQGNLPNGTPTTLDGMNDQQIADLYSTNPALAAELTRKQITTITG